MKINVSKEMLDEDDNVMVLNGVSTTLFDVIKQSILGNDMRDDKKKKIDKYHLWKKKIKNSKQIGFIDLTAEEIVIIKDAIAIFQGPLIMGQSYDLLDNMIE